MSPSSEFYHTTFHITFIHLEYKKWKFPKLELTNLGGNVSKRIFLFFTLSEQLHETAVWLCTGNTCAINYDVTSSRPSAAATDAASRGVAHTPLLHQLTVLLTPHIQMATIQT